MVNRRSFREFKIFIGFELASYIAERIETSLENLVISESDVVEEDTVVDG